MKIINETMPYANKRVWELVRDRASGNVSTFAKMIRKSPQVVNRLLNVDQRSGKYPSLSDGMKKAIIDVFELDENYFIENKADASFGFVEEKMPHIPTKVAAGGTGGISDSITRHDCEYRPIVKIFPKYQITMDVKGDSMSPKYENGDIIALRKVVDIIEWGDVYVLDTADGAVLKRLYDDGNRFKCVSFNPEYKDFYVNKENVYGVWKVVGLIRI